MFITVVGIDGAGKSSLTQPLSMRISEKTQRTVRLTGEPGGTRLGKSIRKLLLELTHQQEQMAHHGALSEPINLFVESPIPLAELLLFSSARAQHCTHIREWLYHGEIVLCDRFSDCTWAYQGALGLRDDVIETIERTATGGLTPDLTLLLDIPVEVAFERLHGSRATLDRIEQSGAAYFEHVRERYLELAERYPHRICVLDATLPPDILLEKAWDIVRQRLEEEKRKNMAQKAKVRKPSPLQERIFAEFAKTYAEGRAVILREVEKATGASKVHVINQHKAFLRAHPEFDTPENRTRAERERVRRMQDAKRAQGHPALRKQAALGYPNLQKGRAVVAANRAQHANKNVVLVLPKRAEAQG